MKFVSKFLLSLLVLIPTSVYSVPVATTAGNNLTAYNPGAGLGTNNDWNTLTNSRSSAPVADFGNCNSLILRCASPKCKNGGCTDYNVARPIVSGCVNSNKTCKKHGDDLIDYITAQLVASSTATVTNNAVSAQQADAQMQEMRDLVAKQADTVNQLQNELAQQQANSARALEEAVNAAASAAANAAVATMPSAPVADYSAGTYSSSEPVAETSSATVRTELTEDQMRAVREEGVDPQLAARQTISGEILTELENAQKKLDELKVVMQQVFEYAGCDERGNNCTGPKRVTVFKDLANKFFDPYEDVWDQLDDAITTAQDVGIDVTNIYQYLNGGCNQWAKYMCNNSLYRREEVQTLNGNDSIRVNFVWPRYDENNCKNGYSVAGAPIYAVHTYGLLTDTQVASSVRGGQECMNGQTIPPQDDASCTMLEAYKDSIAGDKEEVTRNFLYPDEGDYGDMVRVGCTTKVSLRPGRRADKKKKTSVDIEVLQKIINQDAPRIVNTTRNRNSGNSDPLKYCAITDAQYVKLMQYVAAKGLPTKNICITERKLNKQLDGIFVANDEAVIERAKNQCLTEQKCGTEPKNASCAYWSDDLTMCFYEKSSTDDNKKDAKKAECKACKKAGGKWIKNTSLATCEACDSNSNDDCYCSCDSEDFQDDVVAQNECCRQFEASNVSTDGCKLLKSLDLTKGKTGLGLNEKYLYDSILKGVQTGNGDASKAIKNAVDGIEVIQKVLRGGDN